MINHNVDERAKTLFDQYLRTQRASTDRLFGYLMVCQYAGAILWAYLVTPQTWSGSTFSIHPHVFSAIFLGALISTPVCILTWWRAGETRTRYVVAVCQMLMTALLIHVSGGRIETHFHVFGSLAFLAFYRDWRLLIPATLVVLVDHMVRGFYFPASVYGVASGAEWRFIEHAAWVVFEDIGLTAACVRGLQELKLVAQRQAELESTNAEIEARIQTRTAQLQQTEKRKTAILDHALDGILTIDCHGIVLEFNPAAEAQFGMTRDEVLGHAFTELLASDEFGAIFSPSRDLATEGLLNKRIQTTGLRKSGQAFPMELTITSINLEDDVLFTAFVRDVTDQKRLETDLAHAQKMESIGQLAAGVAHEINTPNQYIGDNLAFLKESFATMSGAIGSFQGLRDAVRGDAQFEAITKQLDEEVAKADLNFLLEEVPNAADQALEGVERVAQIVTAMKEFSHPGQEMQTMVDLNRVIKSTVTVAQNEWKYVSKVEFDLQADLPAIQGHPGELGQVILNLMINAVHAIKDRFGSEPSGVIRISSALKGTSVEVTVFDNGCGIPVHVQGRIFEPFYTTKEVGTGTGQGLAISHSVVVQRHNGDLSFETVLGEGTTFRMTLPIEGAEGNLAA